ncbi:MAG: F-type H+-transporting ATPase subunit a [Paraglaciecola sp.]|jgi:F-type H+-transporting ATPase subunit a
MHISPDELIYWQYGVFKLNATIVYTWLLIFILVISATLVTHTLTSRLVPSRWQNGLEIIVLTIEQQIKSIGLDQPRPYMPFLGSLFLFIASANLLSIFPGYNAPTGSLSTTIALALCVFIAVPYFGIRTRGLRSYLASYTQPALIMLPFNIIGELSRTLALAVRLFGNMMSGAMIIGILLVIAPLIFPVVMAALGLLTGMVQAYIFFVLAGVYIAAAISLAQPPNTHKIR